MVAPRASKTHRSKPTGPSSTGDPRLRERGLAWLSGSPGGFDVGRHVYEAATSPALSRYYLRLAVVHALGLTDEHEARALARLTPDLHGRAAHIEDPIFRAIAASVLEERMSLHDARLLAWPDRVVLPHDGELVTSSAGPIERWTARRGLSALALHGLPMDVAPAGGTWVLAALDAHDTRERIVCYLVERVRSGADICDRRVRAVAALERTAPGGDWAAATWVSANEVSSSRIGSIPWDSPDSSEIEVLARLTGRAIGFPASGPGATNSDAVHAASLGVAGSGASDFGAVDAPRHRVPPADWERTLTDAAEGAVVSGRYLRHEAIDHARRNAQRWIETAQADGMTRRADAEVGWMLLRELCASMALWTVAHLAERRTTRDGPIKQRPGSPEAWAEFSRKHWDPFLLGLSTVIERDGLDCVEDRARAVIDGLALGRPLDHALVGRPLLEILGGGPVERRRAHRPAVTTAELALRYRDAYLDAVVRLNLPAGTWIRLARLKGPGLENPRSAWTDDVRRHLAALGFETRQELTGHRVWELRSPSEN
ncbi:MAG: hypothetical protein AB7T63_17345 [Planctomycetota bacterium]